MGAGVMSPNESLQYFARKSCESRRKRLRPGLIFSSGRTKLIDSFMTGVKRITGQMIPPGNHHKRVSDFPASLSIVDSFLCWFLLSRDSVDGWMSSIIRRIFQ